MMIKHHFLEIFDRSSILLSSEHSITKKLAVVVYSYHSDRILKNSPNVSRTIIDSISGVH